MPAQKSFKEWNPRQSYLLPPSPMDWLLEGHLVYFILDVVAQLDLSGITGAIFEKDQRGTQPYSPQMMVALLLYGYCVGVYSSRKLERAVNEYFLPPFRAFCSFPTKQTKESRCFKRHWWGNPVLCSRFLYALGGFRSSGLRLVQAAKQRRSLQMRVPPKAVPQLLA
jgi:hypothetical protein